MTAFRERCKDRDAGEGGEDVAAPAAGAVLPVRMPADAELGRTATVDPDAPTVVAPRVTFAALRMRMLIHQLHTAIGVDAAIAIAETRAVAFDRVVGTNGHGHCEQ